MNKFISAALAGFIATGSVITQAADGTTQLYWGDTHLHTSNSFDAFLNLNESADPDTAYRWARGLPVLHPYTQARVRIGNPRGN